MILSQHLCWVYAPRYLYAANYKSQLLHGRLRRAHSVRRQNQGTRRRATHTPWTRIQLASGPRHGGNSRAHAHCPPGGGGEVPAQPPVFRPKTRDFSAGKAGVLGDSGLSRPTSLGDRDCGSLPLSPESRRPVRGRAARPAADRRPKAGACHGQRAQPRATADTRQPA